MRRSLSLAGLALFVFAAVPRPASADSPSVNPGFPGAGRALGHLRRCLSSLDLSSDQKTAIEAILSAAKPTVQADAQPLKADHQKLLADLAAGADKCAVGQDVLTAHADRAKLKTDIAAVRDQVFAKLSQDQQNQLKGCWQAHSHRFGSRSSATVSSTSGS